MIVTKKVKAKIGGVRMSNVFSGYRITSPYGWRKDPFGGKSKVFHTGIDLVKSHKAAINAFVGGVVTYAKMGASGSGFGGYGNVVAIKDSKGSLHVYAHLHSCAVKVGAKVAKGQVIGYQGNTGNSTGSHLHYEIRKTSSPSHGWKADRENNCYEPTDYLQKFNSPTKSTKSNQIGVVEVIVDKLNVRSSDSFSAPIVQEGGKDKVLKKGSKWKVYNLSNGLYNLGGSQWCSAGKQYVKFTSI